VQVGGNEQPVLADHLAVEADRSAAELGALSARWRDHLRELEKRGWVIRVREDVAAAMPSSTSAAAEPGPELTPEQQTAVAAIEAARGRFAPFVLHGVTGSGKTEVYLQAVEETVSYGRQAIVLVPEISLTPQTCDRFRARFGKVAVLHSHLTPAERHAQWREIASGRVNVVVGARSAIFAPAPRLGLIVIDEEHESSFKQATAPRYHARDVAEWIAKAEGVPLVLGSATPSLETFARCLSGEWTMCRLADRVGGSQLPGVITVDLRERGSRSRGAVSPRLAAGSLPFGLIRRLPVTRMPPSY
jgi:primosomal protein N' (replication factor Y)